MAKNMNKKKRDDAISMDVSEPKSASGSATKESISPVTPALLVTAPLRKTNAEIEGQKMSEAENSKDTGRKRKREEKHNSCLKETVLSSDQSSNVKDTLMILPFEKKSPFWKTFETKEGYKTIAQSPHFSPLLETKEDIREWAAVGMMVTFYGLLEEVKDLRLDVPSSKICSLSSSFAELEKHGFNVAMAQSRINKVLSLQNERAKIGERQKLENKIVELKRQETDAKEKKKAVEKRIVEMKASSKIIDKEIEEMELEFQTTVSTPW